MQDAIAVRKRLGDRIRKLRKERKWSQEELAHESGLARSFTGAIERGERASIDHFSEAGKHLQSALEPAISVRADIK